MKDKLRVGFFRFDNCSEALRDMFQDELINHPRIEHVDWEWTSQRCGQVVVPAVGADFILRNIKSYDLIFLDADDITERHLSAIENNDLWNRVIIFDMNEDSAYFNERYMRKCLLYIKCSYSNRIHKINNAVPLDWGILQVYLDVVPRGMYPEKDTAIICTLQQGYRGCPRDIIIDAIKTADWREKGKLNTVTLAYTSGSVISYASKLYCRDFSPKHPDNMPNWWYIYMHLMNRSKIIVSGSSHSRIGDHRIWEAFSSGNLFCVDAIQIPMPNPMIAGIHYIKFDLGDIPKTLSILKELLKDDVERKRIASAGFNHAIIYHSSKARVEYVMGEILKRLE